jgi:hypothetical protein
MSRRSSIFILFLIIFSIAAPSFAQSASVPESDSDSVRFYTFIDNDATAVPGLFASLAPRAAQLARGARPMVQWSAWANKRKPFFGSLLLVLFFSVITWSVAPNRLRLSEPLVRSKFWSTLFVGALIVAIVLTIVRVSIRTLIGWPLGILTIGALELALLGGLSVVVSTLGRAGVGLIRLRSWPVIGKHEGGARFAELLLGAVICAAILQIPAVGMLPRIGTRIVALLAVLGTGALYRSRTSS